MSWHFRSILSNIYLLPQDNSCSEKCHQNIKLDFNKGYDGTLFELSSHIKHFQEHISYHNINIPLGLEKQSEFSSLNPLSTSLTKWSNTLKQLEKLPTNCLSVFDHFLRLTLKGLVVTVLLSYIGSLLLMEFNTVSAEGFSETRPFMHLSKHVFWSQ